MDRLLDKNLARNNPYMRMFVEILHVGQIIEKQVSIILKQFDITHIQFNVLRSLETVSPGNLSVGEIKDQLIFPTSDITRILDRLVKRQLIHREVCPKNRRKVDVSITQKGLHLIQEILPKLESRFNGYFKDIINEKERDFLTETLKRIK
ncbi:MAG: MarR family transcriptional regulator [Bacteroidales bacterium]|nr:MarR family transcriptional regulator [Bacteroidales bacterium]